MGRIAVYLNGLTIGLGQCLLGHIVRRQLELDGIKNSVLGDGISIITLTKSELDKKFLSSIKSQLRDFKFEILGLSRFERHGYVARDNVRLKVGANNIVHTIVR
jgi:hypothetical protein